MTICLIFYYQSNVYGFKLLTFKIFPFKNKKNCVVLNSIKCVIMNGKCAFFKRRPHNLCR